MDMFGEEPLKSLDEALQVLATENSLAACKKGMGAVKLFLEKVRGCCCWLWVVVGGWLLWVGGCWVGCCCGWVGLFVCLRKEHKKGGCRKGSVLCGSLYVVGIVGVFFNL